MNYPVPDEEEYLIMGFTGTQEGMTNAQAGAVRMILQTYCPDEFHHGDCIGADEEAHRMVRTIRHASPPHIVVHPPNRTGKRAYCSGDITRPEKDYLLRNRDIVDESHAMIATPKESKEQQRSGTWSTVRYAKKQKKHVFLVLPDGTVTEC